MDEETLNRWQALYQNERYHTRYPSEHVIRFLAGQTSIAANGRKKLLDVGCGAGRHLVAADDMGFTIAGVDGAAEAVIAARQRFACAFRPPQWREERIKHADYRALPFDDEAFDLVLCFGVLYYGTPKDMEQGLAEIRRVLVPGGRAFVVLRTNADTRARLGDEIEPGCRRMPEGGLSEAGMPISFCTIDRIRELASSWQLNSIEVTATSRSAMSWQDMDWLLVLEKPNPENVDRRGSFDPPEFGLYISAL